VTKVGIIGSSGFIGGYLSSIYKNVYRYGRENISELALDKSELIIIAAAPATKWIANAEPKKDLENIQNLINSIKCIEDKKSVLISTIDVFPSGTEFNESKNISEKHPEGYGANRAYLEIELRRLLANLSIIRLPGIFGPGLKKNLIYDLMNDRPDPQVNSKSTFQFYDVRSLPAHLALCLDLGLRTINLATEPVTVAEVYSSCFNRSAPEFEVPELHHLMTSKYSKELVGRSGSYILSKQEVLAGLRQWIQSAHKS